MTEEQLEKFKTFLNSIYHKLQDIEIKNKDEQICHFLSSINNSLTELITISKANNAILSKLVNRP